ncbi:MAG: GNAT family N-acetyltransferase [Oceanihabitans sp.]|nr:GNAT family N-acetyltransferase [Oceanihabitans sp.]
MILYFDDFEINPIHSGDAWKLCDFMVANEDRFKRYFPGTLAENAAPTLSQLFVEKKQKQFEKKEEFLFTLKHSKTRELAGIIYIKELDHTIKQGEFAYCIGYPFKGKKIITNAVKLLSEYAFTHLDLESLQIIAHKDNLPSVNVALNNGFVWQKTLEKEFTPTNESPLDMELYELYRPSRF